MEKTRIRHSVSDKKIPGETGIGGGWHGGAGSIIRGGRSECQSARKGFRIPITGKSGSNLERRGILVVPSNSRPACGSGISGRVGIRRSAGPLPSGVSTRRITFSDIDGCPSRMLSRKLDAALDSEMAEEVIRVFRAVNADSLVGVLNGFPRLCIRAFEGKRYRAGGLYLPEVHPDPVGRSDSELAENLEGSVFRFLVQADLIGGRLGHVRKIMGYQVRTPLYVRFRKCKTDFPWPAERQNRLRTLPVIPSFEVSMHLISSAEYGSPAYMYTLTFQGWTWISK